MEHGDNSENGAGRSFYDPRSFETCHAPSIWKPENHRGPQDPHLRLENTAMDQYDQTKAQGATDFRKNR